MSCECTCTCASCMCVHVHVHVHVCVCTCMCVSTCVCVCVRLLTALEYGANVPPVTCMYLLSRAVVLYSNYMYNVHVYTCLYLCVYMRTCGPPCNPNVST